MPLVEGYTGGGAGLLDSFLAGRNAKLEQEKYQFAKEHQAVLDAQKDYELRTSRAQAYGIGGGYGVEEVRAEDAAAREALSRRQSGFQDAPRAPEQMAPAAPLSSAEVPGRAYPEGVPTDSDWAKFAGGGALNGAPGGFIAQQQPPAQGSQFSTVPSTNARANPSQAPVSSVSGLPLQQNQAVRMALLGSELEQQNKIRDAATAIRASGGNADLIMGPNGPTIDPRTLNLGPQKNAEIKNAELQPIEKGKADFDKQESVSTAKKSKVYMDQMIAALNDPSPEAHASLFLNALKIKFPNAPDVNSLEEMKKAEPANVKLRNYVNQYLNGTLDPDVVDNLVRDGMTTFRSNLGGFRSQQVQFKKTLHDAYGLDDKKISAITSDQGLDDTEKTVLALQKKLGPYKTPSEKPGFAGGLISKVGGMLGVRPSLSSEAGDKKPQKVIQNGHVYTLNPKTGDYE
jgi:hypothetical protein